MFETYEKRIIPKLPSGWKIGDPIPAEYDQFVVDSMHKAEQSFDNLNTKPPGIEHPVEVDPHQKVFFNMVMNSRTQGRWGALLNIFNAMKNGNWPG